MFKPLFKAPQNCFIFKVKYDWQKESLQVFIEHQSQTKTCKILTYIICI